MTTFYEKKGRRYFPVTDTEAFSGLFNGSWLVVIENGARSSRRLVDPCYAEVLAAMKAAEDAMLARMLEANTGRPPEKMTAKMRKAYKAYQDIMGDDSSIVFNGCSMMDVIRAGEEALVQAMQKEDQKSTV